MSAPLAFQNGAFLPVDQLSIAVTDAGFVQGITVAEQLRTFRGKLFRLHAHLQRLARSLQIVRVDPGMSPDQLALAASALVEHNHGLTHPEDDLGLSLFVTPGPYATFLPDGGRPTVVMHTYPLPFSLWADKYSGGQHLVVSKTRQVSPLNWPAELKCRSRMHYYLADLEARAADPDARALLLDLDGMVSESSTANVLAFFSDEGIVSPPRDKILPGISLSVLEQLSGESGIPLVFRDLHPSQLVSASEMMLCSTSPCLLPVVRRDGKPVGEGTPGPVYRRLLERWSALVGVDIAAQARQFAHRR